MKLKRIGLVILIFLLFSSQTFAASNQKALKEQKAVKTVARTYFNAVKKYNTAGIIKTMLPKKLRKSLKYLNKGSAYANNIKKMHEYCFEYTIKSVKVRGKTATVKADIEYYDGFWNFVFGFQDTLDDFSDREYSEKKFDELLEVNTSLRFFDSDEELNTKRKSVSLSFKKYNGKWKISKVTSLMETYINCNCVAAVKYLNKLYK